MIIRYVNNFGESVDLNKYPYKMLISDIFDYDEDVISGNDKIIGFTSEFISDKTVSVDVHKTKNKTAFELLNVLTDIFQKDVLMGVPGKLYVDDWYFSCFFKGREMERWDTAVIISCEYKVAFDREAWLKESTLLILPASDPVAAGLTYDYTYDYTYGENGLSVFFENDHFTACDFKLKAYGPFDSLAFAINSNMYEVDADCGEGESLVIDTKAQTITKIDVYGNTWNAFGDQNFDYNNFAKIPAGENTLSYSREYALELTFYQERSEPKWNSSEVEEDTTNVLMTEEGYILATEDGGALILEE